MICITLYLYLFEIFPLHFPSVWMQRFKPERHQSHYRPYDLRIEARDLQGARDGQHTSFHHWRCTERSSLNHHRVDWNDMSRWRRLRQSTKLWRSQLSRQAQRSQLRVQHQCHTLHPFCWKHKNKRWIQRYHEKKKQFEMWIHEMSIHDTVEGVVVRFDHVCLKGSTKKNPRKRKCVRLYVDVLMRRRWFY